MKLRCERDNLLEALATAGRASSGRASSAGVLPGTRLALAGDRLEVTGTDQDITISTEVTVAGLSDGVVVAPGRLLTDIVRALDPGAVLLQGDEEELQVSAGRSQFMLRPYRAGDFPHLSAASGSSVSLSTAGLAEALRQVVRAASSEDTRPVLTGVLVAAEAEGIRLVATDSYRLAVKDLPGARGVLAEGQKVLLPSRALAELQRLLSSDAEAVELRLGAHEVRFTIGQVKLTTRLIEGDFPPYRQLVPFNYPNRLVIGREALLDAIRRVRLVARDATTPARISLRSDMAQLSVITNDWGQAVEEVDAKYEGAEMTIAFNPQYLAEGVEAIAGDEVLLETIDALKPATLKPTEKNDYIYLLMPVRVA
ncbi:MAG TPA: DNA polymerase III subunit beta [Acidimicrobiales bacterium]|nr:DNA polymerase III subunit beta [Acidimicrobiales bacterium]